MNVIATWEVIRIIFVAVFFAGLIVSFDKRDRRFDRVWQMAWVGFLASCAFLDHAHGNFKAMWIDLAIMALPALIRLRLFLDQKRFDLRKKSELRKITE